jgi:hypothetical protein
MNHKKFMIFLLGAFIALLIFSHMWDSAGQDQQEWGKAAGAQKAGQELALAEKGDSEPVRRATELPEVEVWNIEIRVSGSRIHSNGILHYISEGLARSQTALVTEGRCLLPQADWRNLRKLNTSTWFLASNGFPAKVTNFSEGQKESQDKFLILSLGSRKELQVTVTDLRGGPIPYAKLQIYGGVAPEDSRQVCDEFGNWHGEVFGVGKIRLIARAKGYANVSEVVNLIEGDDKAVIHLRLGRFMVIGGVLDRRERFGIRSEGIGIGKYSRAPATPDYRDLLKQIESRSHLDRENEWVTWNVLRENDEWLEGYFEVKRIHPDGVVPMEGIRVELKHILDPTLKLYRFPGAWPKELIPVECQLAPKEKFVSGVYPESIKLNWAPSSGEGVSRVYMGNQIDSNEPSYVFFVAEGDYKISSSKSKRDLRYGKSPLIEPLERVQVFDGPFPQQSLQVILASTCFYSGYVLEYDSGMQLGMAGLLTEVHEGDDPAPSFMSSMFSWPQYQFFTGAPCQLWLQKYGLWAETIGGTFQLAPPKQGEILRIKVPTVDLEQILSRS